MRRPVSYRSLLPLLAYCRGELALAFVIGLLLVPVKLVEPNLNRFLMDYFIVEGYWNWGPPLVAFGLLILLFTLFGTYLWERTKVSLTIRFSVANSSRLMRTLFALPVTFFQTHLPGTLAGYFDSVAEVANAMSTRLVEMALGILSIVCFGALLISYDSVLGLCAVLLAVAVVAMLGCGLGRCRQIAAESQRQNSRLVGIATHVVSMIETVKASGQEDGFFAEFAGLYGGEHRASMRLAGLTLGFYIVQYVAQSVGMTLIVCLGALRILNGQLSCGEYVAFQLVLACFFSPLSRLVDSFGMLQGVFAHAENVMDVLREPVAKTVAENTSADPVGRLDGMVELRDVTFGYDRAQPPLLEHFNLKIAVGERVAIVGLSGSGKSTLAKLLAGTYEPWSGEVLFDGRPRSSYSINELRYSFALVDQEIVLFPGTVRENLALYDESVSFEAVRRAAEDAMVHGAIISRAGGYEAELGPQGANFSGGERQRMEIARALAVDPSILVLDEATAALDPTTEEKLDRNLRRRGVTTIVIAHRLSTIRDADRIVVLKKGRIVETGRHDELLVLDGVYAELVRS